MQERPLGRTKAATVLAPFLLSVALAAGAATARAEARVALVVGNTNYRSGRLPDLPNAARDAAVLGRELEALGFSVVAAADATADGLRGLLSRVEAQEPSGALLFFFAGHAVTRGGETYLLPVDAPDPTSFGRLTVGALRLSALTARFASAERPLLLFLDACGDGPGAAPGLREGNVFVALAAQPGSVAWDGAGDGGSPFARALIGALAVPAIDLREVMARAGAETVRLTFGRQTPWSRSTLDRPFVFRAAGAAVPPGG